MKAGPLLRIASALALLQATAHTSLLLTYTPTHGSEEVAVVAAMQAHRFAFGGFAPHSYWEMYIGYGLFAAFNCLIEAVFFWYLAGAMKTDVRVRPVVLLFALANVGYAALVARYFFLLPMVFDLAIAGLLGVAAMLPVPAGADLVSAPGRTQGPPLH